MRSIVGHISHALTKLLSRAARMFLPYCECYNNTLPKLTTLALDKLGNKRTILAAYKMYFNVISNCLKHYVKVEKFNVQTNRFNVKVSR